MKFKLLTTLGIGLLSLQAFAATQPANNQQQLTQDQKLSYTIGVKMGTSFKKQDVKINREYMLKGMDDAMAGKETLMNKKEMRQTLVDFRKQMVVKRKAEKKALAAENKKAGETFLAKNKTKPGVKTRSDGLQYKIVKAGKGMSPTAKDKVTVNYEGKLIDGKVFDSSYERGKPATFSVSGVIKGWQEALMMMKPGAQWEIYIPSDLAYGKRGAGRKIGPNQALIFKVELLSIEKKKEKKNS